MTAVRIRRWRACALVLVVLVGVAAAAQAAFIGTKKVSAPDAIKDSLGRFLQLTHGSSGITDARLNTSSTIQEDRIDGIDYTPAGWRIRPAGKQVKVFNFPFGITASGDSIFVSSDNGGMQGITTIDAKTLRPTITPSGNLFMGLAVAPNGNLYASGGNADRIFRYGIVNGTVAAPADVTQAATFPIHHALDGTIGRAGLTPLPAGDGIGVPGYPGNSVINGKYLYIAGTLSEPTAGGVGKCPDGQSACARVTVLDTTTNKIARRIPVGLDAYSLQIDNVRHRLYVSNWADEAGRGTAAGGTVSVVDITKPALATEIAHVRVGHHPTAIQLSDDGKRLFVADTNDDTITVLNVETDSPTVVSTESVRPVDGVPVGAYPDAFALSPDGNTLFVALAGMNAIEVRDGHTGARVAGHPMYIPTGWYPSALTVTGNAAHYRLWVTNAKGGGASTKGTGYNFSIGQEIIPFNDGTVSVIDLPTAATQANKWTDTVVKNDRLDRATVDPCGAIDGIRVSEVLCPPAGKTSPVKHVLYIVTENKTFDQYFGDMNKNVYDADPKYAIYGNTVTPNHHALANRFSLSDRFFSDALVSVTGHSWTSGAIATDHNELTFPADYDEGIRGNHGNGDPLKPGIGGEAGGKIGEAEDELQDPEGGYIFEAFKRAGAVPPAQAAPDKLSMAIYGEHTARESGDMDAYKAPHWKDGDLQYFDTCRAEEFISGVASNGPAPDNNDQFGDCSGRTLPAAFNLAAWTKEFKDSGRDVMPNFIYMSLPVNHTLGTNLGSPTPASMVADNDHAIGMIVEALSHSPFWDSTVVMQTEDDTQAAGDHISPLRDYLEVSGPWTQPGANHQWGSMPSLLRTIEQIFGVEPITLFDKLAYPQHRAFRASLSSKPDTRPYAAINPVIPYAINTLGAPGQKESMAMDWSTYDLIDEQLLNAIQYAVARGTPFVSPYAKH